MLVNVSNHPSAKWSKEQMDAAIRQFGEVVDLPFPNVDPRATSAGIKNLAYETVGQIHSLHDGEDATVLVQGEMTLAFAVVKRLLDEGIDVVAATSEREVQEVQQPDGTTKKITVFKFVQFRPYIS